MDAVSPTGIVASTPDAILFLKQAYPTNPWVLVAIDPERGTKDEKQRIQTRTFQPTEEKQCATWINQWQGKRNIYFTVNVVKEPTTKKPVKKDIGWLSALHVDIDPKNPPKDCPDIPAFYAEEQERILLLLNTYSPLPSIILYSGGGYQGFWLLKEPVEVEDNIAQLEAYNKKIEKDLGGDHCFNIDRIMRLPGTINMPDEKKRAKGRVEVLAGVVSANYEEYYSLDDFTPLVEKKEEIAPPVKQARIKREPVEWATRLIAQGNDPEGNHAYSGDRSKAVWAVCCALVRAGWSDEEITETIINKDNKISEHVLHQSDPKKYSMRQAKKAREKVGSEFQVNDKEKIVANQYNIRLALAKLDVTMTFNLFSNVAMIEGPNGEPNRYFDDKQENRLWLMIEEVFKFRPSFEYFQKVIDNEAQMNAYHPVRQYLETLRWDGVERIDSWLTTYAGTTPTPYSSAVGSLILIAAVRRVMQPGAKFDEMMVFISDQGLNKSTALEILATREEWFTDSLPLNADDKQVIEVLSGKWIVEAGELKGMRQGAIEHLKAFLSRRIDRARLSYGRRVSEVPRQCVMFGSTNTKAFLIDTTGNRRFWPIHVEPFDIVALRRDRDQIWAEAAAREAAGASIRLDPELYAYAAAEQEEVTVSDPWTSDIEIALRKYKGGRILPSDIWTILNIHSNQRNQINNQRMGDAIRSLGWERVKARVEEFDIPKWCYVKGTPEERKVRIHIRRDGITGALDISIGRHNNESPELDMDIPL